MSSGTPTGASAAQQHGRTTTRIFWLLQVAGLVLCVAVHMSRRLSLMLTFMPLTAIVGTLFLSVRVLALKHSPSKPRSIAEKAPAPTSLQESRGAKSELNVPAATLHVVSVAKLMEALQTLPHEQVLQFLTSRDERATGTALDELFEVVQSDMCDFALISYRQERLTPDDGTTLSAGCLQSVAAVAQDAGLHGLWLE